MPRPEVLWVAPIIWLISILQNVDLVTVGNLSCKQSIRAVTPFLLLISDLKIFVSKGFGTDRSGYGNQPEVVCKYSLKNWFRKKEKQDSLFWKILKSECTQTGVKERDYSCFSCVTACWNEMYLLGYTAVCRCSVRKLLWKILENL